MTYRVRISIGLVVVISLAGGLSVAIQPKEPGAELEGEIEAVEEAMTAWARFADTGDLATVAGIFAKDGPQFRQLSAEAARAAGRGGAPYLFVLSDPTVLQPGLVRGSVVVSRNDETDQVFLWDIELRAIDGRWQVWTVRTANPGF